MNHQLKVHRSNINVFFLLQLSSLNELDNRGDLALDLALKDRQLGIAKTLLEHNADADARDSKGWTILHRAVERGSLSTKLDGFH